MSNNIWVIGDVMLDRFLHGQSHRISPEAPVPVILQENEIIAIGGAANVARNVQALGGDVTLVGSVGHDAEGRLIRQLIDNYHLKANLYEVDGPTTTKTRIIENGVQKLRLDREAVSILREADLAAIEQHLEESKPSLIVVSDYAKGMISDGLLQIISAYSESHICKILVDPKGTDWHKYGNPYLIKPNLSEMNDWYGDILLDKKDCIDKAFEIFNKLKAQNLWITMAGEGSVLLSKDGSKYTCQASSASAFDVTGAGDTAIAALAYALNAEYSLNDAVAFAHRASAIAVSQPGTYAVSINEL